MYKALLRRQYRDVNTTVPKVLLANVVDHQGQVFRDHCWVKETPEIARLLRKYNSVAIDFVANEILYLKRGKEQATTLEVVCIIDYR